MTDGDAGEPPVSSERRRALDELRARWVEALLFVMSIVLFIVGPALSASLTPVLAVAAIIVLCVGVLVIARRTGDDE